MSWKRLSVIIGFICTAGLACPDADATDYALERDNLMVQLHIQERSRPVSKRAVVRTLRRLSKLEVILSNLPEAEAYARRALEVARTMELHPVDIMDMQHELAHIQDVQERLTEAEGTWRAELGTRSALHGSEHPLTLHSWRDLALNLEHQGRFQEAYDAFLNQLSSLLTIYPPGHHALAGIHMDLGRTSAKAALLPVSIAHYDTAIGLLCSSDPKANCLMLRQAQKERASAACKLAMSGISPI